MVGQSHINSGIRAVKVLLASSAVEHKLRNRPQKQSLLRIHLDGFLGCYSIFSAVELINIPDISGLELSNTLIPDKGSPVIFGIIYGIAAFKEHPPVFIGSIALSREVAGHGNYSNIPVKRAITSAFLSGRLCSTFRRSLYLFYLVLEIPHELVKCGVAPENVHGKGNSKLTLNIAEHLLDSDGINSKLREGPVVVGLLKLLFH